MRALNGSLNHAFTVWRDGREHVCDGVTEGVWFGFVCSEAWSELGARLSSWLRS
jgi:hypothetical protein